MNIRTLGLCVLMTVAVGLTGCVHTVDGRTKAGLPSKDKITSRYERSVPQVVDASRAVLRTNGQIQSDDTVANALHAKVNKRDVWVRVAKVDEKVTEVTVQARNGSRGDIYLASEISKQIGIQLAVGQ